MIQTSKGSIMPVIGADHTSYTVKDMKRSLAFYRDLLGFELINERPQVTNNYFRAIVGLPDSVVHAAELRIPGTSHRLELFEYKYPAGTPQDLTPNNPGSSHVCYLVDDLRALYATVQPQAERYGVQFVSEPVYLDEGPNLGGWSLYMKDPNGILIELFERAPR